MKSAFGSKRKARKIQVDEDEGENDAGSLVDSVNTCKCSTATALYPADFEKLADAVKYSNVKIWRESIQEIRPETQHTIR